MTPRTAADPAVPVLARIERQLHRGLARGSERWDVGGFRLHVWPRPEPFYRNRAVPVEAPADWGTAVVALVAAFAGARREPRLEFFAERWPGLAPALEVAGFRRELEAPVLASDRAPPGVDAPGGVLLLGRGTDPGLVRAALARASQAFGMGDTADPGELAQFRLDLAEGATVAAVRLEGGEPVAGACLVGVGAGDAELAGVWTRDGHRRRGHARAVCAYLLRMFLGVNEGGLVWLTAGGPGSEALYRGLGFNRVGTQLDYALGAGIPDPATDGSH